MYTPVFSNTSHVFFLRPLSDKMSNDRFTGTRSMNWKDPKQRNLSPLVVSVLKLENSNNGREGRIVKGRTPGKWIYFDDHGVQ